MKYMLSYDISSTKKRYRVVKVFEEFACVRVQKSIFFVDCSKETIEKIRQEVKNYFKKESLIIVPLEADMINKALFLYKSPKVRSRGDIFIWNYLFFMIL